MRRNKRVLKSLCLLKVIKKAHTRKTLLHFLLYNAARVAIRATTSDSPRVSDAWWSKAFVPNPTFVFFFFSPRNYRNGAKKINK